MFLCAHGIPARAPPSKREIRSYVQMRYAFNSRIISRALVSIGDVRHITPTIFEETNQAKGWRTARIDRAQFGLLRNRDARCTHEIL